MAPLTTNIFLRRADVNDRVRHGVFGGNRPFASGRTLAASGPMPPGLAARFTTGELACSRIVADAVRDHGLCSLHVDAIAARAGVCRRLAQSAIREAAREGLLTVQERRREGRRNDTNMIRVVSREWLTWLGREGGCKNAPHGYLISF
jgi:hypothetical protein